MGYLFGTVLGFGLAIFAPNMGFLKAMFVISVSATVFACLVSISEEK